MDLKPHPDRAGGGCGFDGPGTKVSKVLSKGGLEGEVWLELKQLNSEPAQWQGAELRFRAGCRPVGRDPGRLPRTPFSTNFRVGGDQPLPIRFSAFTAEVAASAHRSDPQIDSAKGLEGDPERPSVLLPERLQVSLPFALIRRFWRALAQS